MNAPYTLSAEARTSQRDQAASELVRALLIINGGGAAALLAFLTAIWQLTSAWGLIKPTIAALGCLTAGAFFAGLFHLVRYVASLRYQEYGREVGVRWRRVYLSSAAISLLCFVLGVGVLTFFAWTAADRVIRPYTGIEQGRQK